LLDHQYLLQVNVNVGSGFWREAEVWNLDLKLSGSMHERIRLSISNGGTGKRWFVVKYSMVGRWVGGAWWSLVVVGKQRAPLSSLKSRDPWPAEVKWI